MEGHPDAFCRHCALRIRWDRFSARWVHARDGWRRCPRVSITAPLTLAEPELRH